MQDALSELFEATKEGGVLDSLAFGSAPQEEQTPLMHGNVSLGNAISYNASNRKWQIPCDPCALLCSDGPGLYGA